MQKPIVISVITVVYNGAQTLEPTIQSVLGQDYPHIDYVVVDGGSRDGTLDILQRYADRLRYISEPDKGLYDAMNKGLRMATGDFVVFLNAADYFYGPSTLREVACRVSDQVDVIYGDTLLEDDSRQALGLRSVVTVHRLPKRLSADSFRYGMSVCHQAFYARRILAPEYDLQYRLSADIDWCIKVLKRARQTANTDTTLARYLVGGISKAKHKQALRERFVILSRHYGFGSTLLAHIWIVARAAWHKLRYINRPTY